MQKLTLYISLLFIFVSATLTGYSQPGSTIELKKPDKYEKRTLASEKTGNKKFGYSKRLYQNTITHYNYYFNADNKLREIIEEAKRSFKDDYTKLLPFYNYSLDITSGSSEIDSVIYKCYSGILLHDLRNDWIDNLYLLLGEAYFYRKNFDSADQVFRYMNYAWAPKEKGGYDIPVGSNASNTEGIFSVATKENNSFTQKVFATPPSRNESLLWQSHNYIETENYGEAGGILEILLNDPVFPARLQPQLNELIAYWNYRQGIYDSAVSHLVKALDAADTKQDKARMEFLIAQMYQLTDSSSLAVQWYNKSAEHTTDPIMEVYANLNSIKTEVGKEDNILKEKLDNLLKMAKRDKYFGYRDIIYYAIAQVELEMKDDSSAQRMLKKSIYYNTQENPEQRSKSFLMLGDINYDMGNYVAAKNFYDSVETSSLNNDNDRLRVDNRLPGLTIIANGITVINREDSVQKVAAMPKDQRDAYVKKMVRTLRKQQGLKEEPELSVNPAVQQTAGDLFNAGKASASDWYFNNLSLKSTGYNQFRANWGSRPNADNWRRLAAIRQAKPVNDEDADDDSDSNFANDEPVDSGISITDANGEITFESVSATLPLTEEQVTASNEKISDALFRNAVTFQDKLENYPAAINTYLELLRRFPGTKNKQEAMFNLYYCYNKTGNKISADSVRSTLTRNFPDGEWTAKLNNKQTKATAVNDPATEKYKQIYDLFISGDFQKAEEEKAKADSTYGNSYWTPQLLYIESVYYVSKREDSTAIDRLGNLQKLYPQTPLAEKAATMIDVLNRRGEIETYLTNLQIKRYEDDQTVVVDLTPVKPTIEKADTRRDSVVNKPTTQVAKTNVDTTKSAAPVIRSYQFEAKDPHYVAILLDKVAPVFINEARNAFDKYNKINFYNQKLNITPVKLDDRYNLVLIGPFTDAGLAVEYMDKTRPVTTSRILPWLTADKYTYTIISDSNLDVMKETKDVDSYKKLLDKVLPGKF